MPYTLEIVAEKGPLPRPEVLLEWLRVSAPGPMEVGASLTVAPSGDRFVMELPLRCDTRDACAHAMAALRAARELRMTVRDPQLNREVAEPDVDAILARWRQLRDAIPSGIPPVVEQVPLTIHPVKVAMLLVFLTAFAAVVFATFSVFASLSDVEVELRPADRSTGRR